MSIALMHAAWRTDLPVTRKMVLLALADQANDRGECYPSIPEIAVRASLGVRVVYDIVGELTDAGYLQKNARAGRCTQYQITDAKGWPTPAPSAGVTPAQDAGVGDTPAPRAGVEPLQLVQGCPAPRAGVQGAAKRATPYRDKSKSKSKSKSRSKAAREARELPSWLQADAWAKWDRYRRAKSGKGWTDDAVELSLRTLEKLRAEGHDPTAVIEQSVGSGWSGLFPVHNSKQPARAGPHNGNRNDRMAGVQRLEEMKHELADDGNSDGPAEASLFAPRQLAGHR